MNTPASAGNVTRSGGPAPSSHQESWDQALIYRLSGDRNPLHSDPWFARELAGFPKPILHGLCSYGVAGRALVAELGKGVAANVTSIDARFSSPVFPGETLTTLIWRTEPGKAVFRTEAAGPDGADARVVLDDGAVEYAEGSSSGRGAASQVTSRARRSTAAPAGR